MARTRAEANQSLYRARIVLNAWDRLRDDRNYPELQLAGAFLPGLRQHLADAYGWFLLSVSGVEEIRDQVLPRDTAALPPPEPGRARAPELQEFAQLERAGWIGEMLDSASVPFAATRGAESLLVSDQQSPGYAVAARWVESLAQIMARMDDSLAEC